MSKTIFIINGPNLNLLGKREPEVYGHATLKDVEENCTRLAQESGFEIKALQSNWEGQIVDWIQQARSEASAIIINPGALSHYSIAVLDALKSFEGLVIEVHISQIHRREEFRHHSFVSSRADAVLVGFGVNGYALALRHLLSQLS